MTDHPLPLPAVRVRALLAGSMTQIRLPAWGKPFALHGLDDQEVADLRRDGHKVSGPDDLESRIVWAPTRWQRVKAGDRIWCREAWQAPTLCPVQYRATDTARIGHWDPAHGPWRSSAAMPRWASRLTLTVTAPPRMEPLHSISEEDAMAEGVTAVPGGWWHGDEREPRAKWPTAQRAFAGLWTLLHGLDAWAENPTVCAISFRVTHANIDASEAA